MCPQCRAFITTHDRVCPYCHEAVGVRAVDRDAPVQVLGGTIAQNQFTTIMLLLVNFGLYAATVVYSMKAGNESALMNLDPQTLYRFGAKYGPSIFRGEQWWRLLTAGYLHGGLIHIGMNCWVLYDLGPQIDEIYGTSRYFVFYTLSTIGGFLLSSYWSPLTPSVGASAGLVGLIGVMIALGVGSKTAVGAAIRGTYIRWAITLFLFGFIGYFRVDNAAHLGGMVTGFVAAYFAGTPRISSTSGEQGWRMAAWACAALTIYCFIKMYLAFSAESL